MAHNKISLGHTFAAIIVCVIVYLIMIYIVTPVADKLLTIFAKIFVPERYGGGSFADDPGLLNQIITGMLMNWFSAYAAFYLSFKWFDRAHARIVAVSYGFFVLAGTVMFAYAVKKEGFAMLLIPIVMAPSLYLSYKVWIDEGLTD